MYPQLDQICAAVQNQMQLVCIVIPNIGHFLTPEKCENRDKTDVK